MDPSTEKHPPSKRVRTLPEPSRDSRAESSSGQQARWSTFILVKTRLEQRHFSSTVQKPKAYDVELCQGRAGKKKNPGLVFSRQDANDAL